MTHYLILGNGAAGATAAEGVRQRDARGEITVLSPEPHPMYSRPGLAYVLLNEIPAKQIYARTPEWYAQRQLQRVQGAATRLDVDAHTVTLASGRALPYDRLLIATGARAAPLPYPGAGLTGVAYLDTFDGTVQLLQHLKRAQRAVVVGGGITALEMAEGFAHHRVETHYLVRREALWSVVLNAEESQWLDKHMRAHHIHIHYNTEIAEVLGDKKQRVTSVRLNTGATLPCEVVGAGIGVKAEWVLKHLVAQGERAVAFDLSTDKHRLDWVIPPAEQATITFVQGDLTDGRQVKEAFRAHAVTHVVHLAALQIPFCRANPALGAQVNVTGTVNLFEAAREAGVRHVAYASSIAVYGPASEYPAGPIAHTAPHAPKTFYGVYKVANEGTARIYWQDHGISSLGLRPYTVYGVGRDQGLTSDPTKAMWAAVKGEPYEIGFSGVMQFQLASDVALQFIAAAQQVGEGAPVFNLGTPPASVDEVMAFIREVKPAAHITRQATRLPFPESFDEAALRAHVPQVYATPLAEGVRLTMEQFARLG